MDSILYVLKTMLRCSTSVITVCCWLMNHVILKTNPDVKHLIWQDAKVEIRMTHTNTARKFKPNFDEGTICPILPQTLDPHPMKA